MDDYSTSPSASSTPFSEARTRASSFGIGMVYATAAIKSLEAIEEAQRLYDFAIENEDQATAAIKEQEISYFLEALRFSSLLDLIDDNEQLSWLRSIFIACSIGMINSWEYILHWNLFIVML